MTSARRRRYDIAIRRLDHGSPVGSFAVSRGRHAVVDLALHLLCGLLFRRRQELSAPGAPFGVHGLDIPTQILRKLLTRSGSRGVSRMTAGLSSVGPPPTLMMIQLLDSAIGWCRRPPRCRVVLAECDAPRPGRPHEIRPPARRTRPAGRCDRRLVPPARRAQRLWRAR